MGFKRKREFRGEHVKTLKRVPAAGTHSLRMLNPPADASSETSIETVTASLEAIKIIHGPYGLTICPSEWRGSLNKTFSQQQAQATSSFESMPELVDSSFGSLLDLVKVEETISPSSSEVESDESESSASSGTTGIIERAAAVFAQIEMQFLMWVRAASRSSHPMPILLKKVRSRMLRFTKRHFLLSHVLEHRTRSRARQCQESSMHI